MSVDAPASGLTPNRDPLAPRVVEGDLAAGGEIPLGDRIKFGARNPENVIAVIGGVFVLVLCIGFFRFAAESNPDNWVPVMVAVSLICITLPIIFLCTRAPRDVRLRRILILALLIKLLFSGPRYYFNEVYYKGEGDAGRYDQAGGFLVENLQTTGQFTIKGSELAGFPSETRIVGYFTGCLYLIFGASNFGGYLVFSWLSWIGLLFFFRAFQIAQPNAPPYLAAMCIFFFPSMLFWPSSIGKDALMVFLIGLLTMGSARLLTGRKPLVGLLWIALAGGFMAEIRPHIVAISAVALMASALASPKRDVGRRGAVGRLAVVILLIPVLVSLIGRIDTVMGTSAGGSTSIESAFNENVDRTQIGGSAFAATPVRTPIDIPQATISVLYRPFVYEARSVPVLLSALEGTLLLVLTVLGFRWLWRIGPVMYRSPFAAFCGTYVLAFVIAFSSIANAGILSRQRVQMYPLLMLLACIAHEQHRLSELAKEAKLAASLEAGEASRNVGLPVPSQHPMPSEHPMSSPPAPSTVP